MAIPQLSYSIVHDPGPEAPVLILGNALGTTRELWAGVAYRMADDYRVVTFDLPGHDPASHTADDLEAQLAGLTLADIAAGVIAIADAIGADTFLYAGLSISGGVAMQLALDHPDRLTAVVALCAAPKFGDAESWDERIAAVRADGTRSLIPDTADRWFAAGFLDEDNPAGPMVCEMLGNVPDAGYIACCQALSCFDITDRISDISTPILFVAGAQDIGNPPESMRALAEQVDAGEATVIPDAAHIVVAEHPDLVCDALTAFFSRTENRS